MINQSRGKPERFGTLFTHNGRHSCILIFAPKYESPIIPISPLSP
jgi:hypothetical protein